MQENICNENQNQQFRLIRNLLLSVLMFASIVLFLTLFDSMNIFFYPHLNPRFSDNPPLVGILTLLVILLSLQLLAKISTINNDLCLKKEL